MDDGCAGSSSPKSKAEEVAMNHNHQSSAMDPSRNMIDDVELDDDVELPIDDFPQNAHDHDSDFAFETPVLNDKKGGRQRAKVWKLLSDDDNALKSIVTACKHCKYKVKHSHKNEYVKTHLQKCKQFREFLETMEEDQWPDWWPSKKQKVESNKKQSSMKDHLPPKLTDSEQKRFDENIAMFFIMTGTPFQRVEDPSFAKALKILRPDVKVPSRKRLSGPLLNSSFTSVQKKVDGVLDAATMCITTDGWSNIKNEPIVNYMAASPTVTLFLESVSTGTQGHSSQWIASDIHRIIETYPKTIFAGAVTDNTSANKLAWRILAERHPSMYFQGCTSHGLNLLVKDILGATKTMKAGEEEKTYPTGYPFEYLLEFVKDCKDIVKVIQNNYILKRQLLEKQQASIPKKPALAQPAPTRWGSIKACCESILLSEGLLLEMVSLCRKFTTGGDGNLLSSDQKKQRLRIQKIIKGDNFVKNLKLVLAILTPIDTLIVKYQSDKVPVSEVWHDFHELPKKFQELLQDNTINITEFEYLEKLCKSRFDFMRGKAHGLAYILDPRFIGQDIDPDMSDGMEMENGVDGNSGK